MDNQSEHFYCRIDGQEIGPLTQAALKKFLQNQAGEVLVRAAREDVWRSPKEFEYPNESSKTRTAISESHPSLIRTSSDQQENQKPTENKVIQIVILVAIVLVLTVVAVIYFKQGNSNKTVTPITAQDHSANNIRSTFKENSGAYFLASGKKISDIPDGNYYFSNFLSEDGDSASHPTNEFTIQIKNNEATIYVKAHRGDGGRYDVNRHWEHWPISEKLEPLQYKGITPDENCAFWGASSPEDDRTIDFFEKVAQANGIDPYSVDTIHPKQYGLNYRYKSISVTICVSPKKLDMLGGKAFSLMYALASSNPVEAMEDSSKSATNSFSVASGQLLGKILSASVEMSVFHSGVISNIRKSGNPIISQDETNQPSVAAPDFITISGKYLYGYQDCGDSPLPCEMLWIAPDPSDQNLPPLLQRSNLYDPNFGDDTARYLIIKNYEEVLKQAGIPVINEATYDNCLLKGRATFRIKVPRTESVQTFGESSHPLSIVMGDLDSVVSMEIPHGPKGIEGCSETQRDSGDALGVSEGSTELGHSLTESYYRFKDVGEVLSVIRRKESPDWNARSLTDCLCAISGNIVELSASGKIVLYNDHSGPSVVTYSWEDNHGNPYTHFYRYDGSWVDVGKEIMPNYPGEPGRYFESNSKGITVYRGGDLELLKYEYSGGKFVRRFQ